MILLTMSEARPRDEARRQEDRRGKEWAGKVTEGVRESSCFMQLWNDAMLDPRKEPVPIFQLAYALVLDKPIILVVPHGAHVPENIKRVARALEYFDYGDLESLHAATLRAFKAVGVEPQH
jgi:hypothetical protein